MSLTSPHVGQRDVCEQVDDKVVIVSVSASSKFVRAAATVALSVQLQVQLLTTTQIDHSCSAVLSDTSGLSEKLDSFQDLYNSNKEHF